MKHTYKKWTLVLALIPALMGCTSTADDAALDDDSAANTEVAVEDVDERVLLITQSMLSSLVSNSGDMEGDDADLTTRFVTFSPEDGLTIDFQNINCTSESGSGATRFFTDCQINYILDGYRLGNCENQPTFESYIVADGGMEGDQTGTLDVEDNRWTSLSASLSDSGLTLTLYEDTLDAADGALLDRQTETYDLVFSISVVGYSGPNSRSDVVGSMTGNIEIQGPSGTTTLSTEELLAVTDGGESCDYVN